MCETAQWLDGIGPAFEGLRWHAAGRQAGVARRVGEWA